jgi:hypothetical protein
MLSQDTEEPITAYFQLRTRLLMQKKVQLAGTYSRLAHPNVANVPRDAFCFICPAVNRSIALVVSLATNTHELASPADI